MRSHVFLDESGDLGFKFNQPYRSGGSSRYLTLGYLICPITDFHIPKRIVRDVYHKFRFDAKKEIKASDLQKHHKDFICASTIKMMEKHPHFILGGITVKKEKVLPHIRADGNILYNYMMRVALIEKVQDHQSCKITRDYRYTKIASSNSCIDYLQTFIWLENNKPAVLTDNPCHSHTDDGLIFIDWITNIIWSKYEDGYEGWHNQLHHCLSQIELFF
ncbi:DUF3800 domain-containing protein [Chitinophaga sp. Cy-1792]|uniref:DUF3800 domain-containing protein n=1 Tax=Chitinophaga sp. Cy-1792 TaxID=2608339 RepID=UPI00141F894C|nr:DUF3800 domain-containing protein [Chitinophaga sp. Cy-1792]NIG57145.1 DUF3800 domain-containing protein [Chitinophaga sp. Cy-1792]